MHLVEWTCKAGLYINFFAYCAKDLYHRPDYCCATLVLVFTATLVVVFTDGNMMLQSLKTTTTIAVHHVNRTLMF